MPVTDLEHALKTLSLLQGKVEGQRTLWWYDNKSYNDKFSLKGTRPFKATASFEEAFFGNAFDGLLSEFGDNDLFMAWDGRRSGVLEKMRKKMSSAIKHSEKFTKRPLGQPFRVHYNNSEFNDGGYARCKVGESISSRPLLPDPCESVLILAAKGAKTSTRNRLYVDLPGTNLTRGLSGAQMKTKEEHEVQVPKATHVNICKDMKAAVDTDDQGGFPGMPGAELPATDEDQETAPVTAVHPWPFTMSLEMHREMLNMFKGDAKTKVVNFTVGFGMLESACLAEGLACHAFTLNATHRAFVHQRILLAVTVDMLRGGTKFIRRRVLSRERSLGGADAPSSSEFGSPDSKRTIADHAPQGSEKVEKDQDNKSGGDDGVSESSESSADSGED